MAFRVLGVDDEGAREWRHWVERLPRERRDIHLLHDYGLVYRNTFGHEPFLAVCGDEDLFVIQAFVKRGLNHLPFLQAQPAAPLYFDIANLYGYGGPVASADPGPRLHELVMAFETHLLAYCRQQQYASEFCVLHPSLDGISLLSGVPGIEPATQKCVVHIDLAVPDERRWEALRKGHKSSIAKARRSGVRVEKVAISTQALDRFGQLYHDTMLRKGAQARWFLPEDYFASCARMLGEHRVSLFFAQVEEQLAGASMLIHDFETVYYHFSGTDPHYRELGVGNLMVFEMAQWAASQGYRRMHLGGGVSSAPGDSLYRFKSGFSACRSPLYTYGRVLDSETYQRLSALKVEHEKQTTGQPADADYFPLYRRQ